MFDGVGGSDGVLVLEISEDSDLDADISWVGDRVLDDDSDSEKVWVNVGEAVRDKLKDSERV